MHIKQITAKNFKRFTDLTITDLPKTARLIVLVGPNGCGKSSLFDAMNKFMRDKNQPLFKDALMYFYKGNATFSTEEPYLHARDLISIEFHDNNETIEEDKKIYIRTAYRHTATIDAHALNSFNESHHFNSRVQRLNEHNSEIAGNHKYLYANIMKNVFAKQGKTDVEIVDSTTESIQRALLHVMPDLQMLSLENPERDSSAFYFSKGTAQHYAYENLSSGECSAFDTLLDMFVKRTTLPDAVQCIDEPESHIAIGAHGRMLEAMYGLIPENSQLWIATHSIGMLRKASQIASEHPDEVVFLSFDEQDFDKPVTLTPVKPNRAFWNKMHRIALEDLSTLIAPDVIIICESAVGFDAKCYNTIFADTYPNVQFVSIGSKKDLIPVQLALERSEIGARILTLRDRDDMAPEQVKEERTSKNRVLSRMSIEDYLLDHEVLGDLCKKYNLNMHIQSLKRIRDTAENLKDAGNKIRTEFSRLSSRAPIGDNREAFMEYTLAPLITPDKKVYKQLERDIFSGID